MVCRHRSGGGPPAPALWPPQCLRPLPLSRPPPRAAGPLLARDLGEGGAEQLLGHGDMLFLHHGGGVPTRVHGAFVSDEEVHRVVADWKTRGQPVYIESITQGADDMDMGAFGSQGGNEGEESDALYDEAVRFVTESRKASISAVQRKLRIGYNRAARMIESMEAAGVVSEMSGNGSREVIAPPPPRG